jgi:hypothetical protein
MSYDFPVQGIGKLISLQITATYGCTDSTAFNYNPSATVSNGTCIPFIYGCTVQFSSTLVNAQGLPAQATNYNSIANTNQVSFTDTSDPCNYGPSGCTTQFAGSGTPQQLTAQFYDPTAVTDDGSCAYLGCTDPSQANYNPYATANDPNNPCIASLIHIPDPHFRYVLVNGTTTTVNYGGQLQNIPFWEVVSSTATPISGFGINNSSWRNIYGIIDPNGEYIDETLVTGITHLDLTNSNSGLSATNLTGINYFTALKVLKCNDQSLGALNVSQNTALIELRCSDNQLTSLNVTQNTALTKFYCSNNQLTSLDVSQNTALTTLYCGENNFSSSGLDVSNNTALETLGCAQNKLSSVNFIGLSSLPALKTLDCSKQDSTSLLTSLDLSGNPNLQYVNCSSNNIGPTLNILQNLGLTYLDCSGQGQGSNPALSLIAGLNSGSALPLITLRCYNNLLTAVQVSNYPNLKNLLCSGNRLTSLDVTANTNLVDLRCGENYLTSLDLSNNIKLERVSANSNSFGWAFGTTASNYNSGPHVPNINNILNIKNGVSLGNGMLNNPNGTQGRFNASRLWPLNNAPMRISANAPIAAAANYSNVDSNTTFIP